MRVTWPGATSGRIFMVTGPLLVSRMSVLSRLASVISVPSFTREGFTVGITKCVPAGHRRLGDHHRPLVHEELMPREWRRPAAVARGTAVTVSNRLAAQGPRHRNGRHPSDRGFHGWPPRGAARQWRPRIPR